MRFNRWAILSPGDCIAGPVARPELRGLLGPLTSSPPAALALAEVALAALALAELALASALALEHLDHLVAAFLEAARNLQLAEALLVLGRDLLADFSDAIASIGTGRESVPPTNRKLLNELPLSPP